MTTSVYKNPAEKRREDSENQLSNTQSLSKAVKQSKFADNRMTKSFSLFSCYSPINDQVKLILMFVDYQLLEKR